MRHNKYGHYGYNDTARKRAAFLRKQQKQREAYPLFSDQIAEEQISVDNEFAARKVNYDKHIVEARHNRAKDWIRARQKLRSYPEEVRKELYAYWQRCRWPADPSYLLSMMLMYDTNRLDLYPAPIKLTEESRRRVNECIARLLARKEAGKANQVAA